MYGIQKMAPLDQRIVISGRLLSGLRTSRYLLCSVRNLARPIQLQRWARPCPGPRLRIRSLSGAARVGILLKFANRVVPDLCRMWNLDLQRGGVKPLARVTKKFRFKIETSEAEQRLSGSDIQLRHQLRERTVSFPHLLLSKLREA